MSAISKHRLLGACLLALLSWPPLAVSQQAREPDYYEDRARGWFWREVRPVAKPATPTPKPPPPTSGVGQGTDTAPAPAPLTSEWIRQNLDRYRDLAMDDPTPENVERYMLLQRYAVDKADRFSTTWMQVVRNTPYLDESINRPLSTAGKNTTQAQILEFRYSLLKKLADRGIGIWYFYRSDCPYCVRQEASLAIVERVHGLPVLPISMDGLPPPTDAFARYVLDSGQAQTLSVRGTPTLYLNNTADGSVERLTVGLRAADEIEDALIHAARRANWITEEEFVRATQGRAFPLLVDGEPPPADLANDPDMLLAYLRATAAPDQFTPIDPSRSPGAAR